jgi:hypothetical protein
MDIVIGVLSAALLIGLSSLLGRSLDRARRRSLERKGAHANADADFYGEF